MTIEHDGSGPGAGLPQLQWASNGGSVADALGLAPDRCWRIEAVFARAMNEGGGVRHVLDTLQAELRDLTFEEWTASVFLLGSYRYAARCTESDNEPDCPAKHGGSCHASAGGCVGRHHEQAVAVIAG